LENLYRVLVEAETEVTNVPVLAVTLLRNESVDEVIPLTKEPVALYKVLVEAETDVTKVPLVAETSLSSVSVDSVISLRKLSVVA